MTCTQTMHRDLDIDVGKENLIGDQFFGVVLNLDDL